MKRSLVVALLGAVLLGAGAAPARESSEWIVFVRSAGGGSDLYAVRSDGSALRRLTWSPRIEEGSPEWSPDGKRIAFLRGSGIWVARDDGSGARLVARGGSHDTGIAWSRDGRIAYSAHNEELGLQDLALVSPDGSGQRFLGLDPNPAGQERRSPSFFGLTWAPDDRTLVFGLDNIAERDGIFTVRDDGTRLRQLTRRPGDVEPAFSRDGERIALERKRLDRKLGYDIDVWIGRPDASRLRRLTRSDTFDKAPTWSPDGRRLAFVSERGSKLTGDVRPSHIFVVDLGGRSTVRLTSGFASDTAPAWQPR